jgi:hypothetical protein
MDGKQECRRGQINALGGGLVYLHDSKTKENFWLTLAPPSVSCHTLRKNPPQGPPSPGPMENPSHHGVPSKRL